MTLSFVFDKTINDPIHQPSKNYYVLQRKFNTINGIEFCDDLRTANKKIAIKEFNNYKKLEMTGYAIRILKISSEVITN